jgi:cytochrome c biogenesis protein CcmG, thiol:disulfide interchange protein DsbE
MHPFGPIILMAALTTAAVAEPVSVPGAREVGDPQPVALPAHWLVGTDEQRTRYHTMVGQPAPLLAPLSDWYNGEVRPEDVAGRIVVVAFWATWSPPSLQSIAILNLVQQRYGRHGVTVLGICASGRDDDQMTQIAAEHDMQYATARAPSPDGAELWGVTTWPTLFVIDRHGLMRAAGVRPQFIDQAVAAILVEQPPHLADEGVQAETPENIHSGPPLPELWREGNAERRQMLLDMETQPPPPLSLHGRIGQAVDLQELRGRVVLLHFWRTTPGTGLRGMTLTRNMGDRYRDEGLTVIGIYAGDDLERMAAAVERFGINYPVAADRDGATVSAYRVDGYPDYYLIGRDGRLRVADCGDRWVDNAVRWLLRGGPDAPAPQHQQDRTRVPRGNTGVFD